MIGLAAAVTEFVEKCDVGSVRRALASLAFAALLYARTKLPLTLGPSHHIVPRRARSNDSECDE